jgi:hypothetical protein
VTVYVRQLERLVVNEEYDTILRRQKRVETDSRECWHEAFLSLSHDAKARRDLKAFRISSVKSAGCSNAAKCPPLSSSFQ